ncbi:hypothetical protein JTE90_001540 [Oedothorax gibbosus]|uniref:Toll-interacting protein n=1 Tax=Oedothorax gibbosus TaxID=931172 RepID=A0AAV6VMY8_9ARAC|nr:hypothetical protein JTE90_001540 [Oedothorax gibbosus]
MTTPKYAEQRDKVLIGRLPEDFLRVDTPEREQATNASAQSLQAAQQFNYTPTQTAVQITMCIVQAQLTKNYSLTKMDPYCRVRIGHSIFETHSDIRGGKLPNWNKTITSYLAPGIKTINIDVYDEKTLTPDERIAYAEYVIPEEAMQGKFMDAWIPLSGKQGEGKEGSINITIYIRSVPYMPTIHPTYAPSLYNRNSPIMVAPQPVVGIYPQYLPGQPMPVGYPMGPQPLQNPNYGYPVSQPYSPSEEDVKQMQEMFPAYDKEVILGVLESCRGNKEQVITSLLSLSDK